MTEGIGFSRVEFNSKPGGAAFSGSIFHFLYEKLVLI